jgi:hypothetical protein
MAIGDQSMKLFLFAVSLSLSSLPFGSVYGQESSLGKPNSDGDSAKAVALSGSSDNPASKDPRYQALEKMLSNVVLVGMFTVDRKPMKDLSEERYEIKSIQKLSADDDLWALEARIKYGAHDVTVPIVTTIKWADQTPVMTMDRLLIPGLGTFSARVVFHDGKYAGTWTHDENGGHLFGRIEAPKP